MAGHAAPADSPVKSGGLTAYAVGPQIWIKRGPETLMCYRAHTSQKYPYVYPLAGPASGLPLTSESGDPFPHHRSMFFGCDLVNGVNFWSAETKPGKILSSGPVANAPSPMQAAITDDCAWTKADGSILMRDRRMITVSTPAPGLILIDWDITWTAMVDIRIPKTNHSLFAIRAAHDITPAGGGTMIDSEGRNGEKATFGQTARWCGFHGRRRGMAGAPVEGLCLMDHPQNPWGLSPWFTRDYGFASPTPLFFRKDPWTLAADKSVRLRYRVAGHVGTPAEAGLDALHAAWSNV